MTRGAWLQPVTRIKPQLLRFPHVCCLPSALFSSSPLYHPGNPSGPPGLKPHLTHIRCSVNYRLASTPHQPYKFSYGLFHSKNTQKMTAELFKFTSPSFSPQTWHWSSVHWEGLMLVQPWGSFEQVQIPADDQQSVKDEMVHPGCRCRKCEIYRHTLAWIPELF